MSFFRQFPYTTYDFTGHGVTTSVVDLFRNVTASSDIKLDPSISYTTYTIINGERPDTVSHALYQDTDYFWTFFIVNDSLKAGLPAWPLSESNLNEYLTREYDSYGVISIAPDSLYYTGISGYYYVDSSGIMQTVGQPIGPIPLSPIPIAYVDSPQSGSYYTMTGAVISHIAPSVMDNTYYGSSLTGIDFTSVQVAIQDSTTGMIIPVMKYDSVMQQLWLKVGGVGNITLTTPNTSSTYSYPPNIVVVGGTGRNCIVEGVLSSGSTGYLTGCRIVNPGVEYTTSPTSIIVTDIISGSTATLTLNNDFTAGVVTNDIIQNLPSSTFSLVTMNPYLSTDPSQYDTDMGLTNYQKIENDRMAWDASYAAWKSGTIGNGALGITIGEYKPTRAYGAGRDAIHHYEDVAGVTVSAQDVYSGLQAGPIEVTYYEYENRLNEQRSRIRVVAPPYIRAFVQQYREVLNA